MTNKSLNIYKTIISYCLKCRKNTESKNPKVLKTKKGRIINAFIKSIHRVIVKKSKFLKEQEEARGIIM